MAVWVHHVQWAPPLTSLARRPKAIKAGAMKGGLGGAGRGGLFISCPACPQTSMMLIIDLKQSSLPLNTSRLIPSRIPPIYFEISFDTKYNNDRYHPGWLQLRPQVCFLQSLFLSACLGILSLLLQLALSQHKSTIDLTLLPHLHDFQQQRN